MAEGIESDDDMAADNASDEEQYQEPPHSPAMVQANSKTAAPAAAARVEEPVLPALDSELYLDEEMSLGEGALQPLEVEYEQPPLTAGGTVTKVCPPDKHAMLSLLQHYIVLPVLCWHSIGLVPVDSPRYALLHPSCCWKPAHRLATCWNDSLTSEGSGLGCVIRMYDAERGICTNSAWLSVMGAHTLLALPC